MCSLLQIFLLQLFSFSKMVIKKKKKKVSTRAGETHKNKYRIASFLPPIAHQRTDISPSNNEHTKKWNSLAQHIYELNFCRTFFITNLNGSSRRILLNCVKKTCNTLDVRTTSIKKKAKGTLILKEIEINGDFSLSDD